MFEGLAIGAIITARLIFDSKYSGKMVPPRKNYVVPCECPMYEISSRPVLSNIKSMKAGRSFVAMSS